MDLLSRANKKTKLNPPSPTDPEQPNNVRAPSPVQDARSPLLDSRTASQGAGNAEAKKRSRKKPDMDIREQTSLQSVLEISGMTFTCDEDDGIQQRSVKVKGKLVGLPEKTRRFHTQLRDAEKADSIPTRPEGVNTWMWNMDQKIDRIFQIIYKQFNNTRYICRFSVEAGPNGTHACMGMLTRPPFFRQAPTGEKQEIGLHMMHYEPENRDWRSTLEGKTCEEFAEVIKKAPKGRWFFFGGEIPDDFREDLLPAIKEQLGLEHFALKQGDKYICAIGMKSASLYPFLDFKNSWASGPGRVGLTVNLHKVKASGDLDPLPVGENPRCENCKNLCFTKDPSKER